MSRAATAASETAQEAKLGLVGLLLGLGLVEKLKQTNKSKRIIIIIKEANNY